MFSIFIKSHIQILPFLPCPEIHFLLQGGLNVDIWDVIYKMKKQRHRWIKTGIKTSIGLESLFLFFDVCPVTEGCAIMIVLWSKLFLFVFSANIWGDLQQNFQNFATKWQKLRNCCYLLGPTFFTLWRYCIKGVSISWKFSFLLPDFQFSHIMC